MEAQACGAGDPEWVGPYRVLGVLRRSGMSRDYLVAPPSGTPHRCLKTLPFLDVADEDTRERFRREVLIHTRLRHPNLCAMVDWGYWEDATPYLVTELCDASPLADSMPPAKPPWSWERARPMVAQTLQGLEAMHQAGIVHRNLCPANILTDAAGSLWITDFTLSAIRDGGPSLTVTGQSLGDLLYISPEQLFDAKRADGRTDLFSVAVIAYQALTGQLPSGPAAGHQAFMTRLTSGDHPPLRELRPDLPLEVEAWLESLLAVDRNKRPATAAQALSTLPAL